MWCPQCGSEFRPGFHECSDCRVPLVAEQPVEIPVVPSSGTNHSHDDIKTAMLGRFDLLQAPIVVQMLTDEGIFAMQKLTDEPMAGPTYGLPTGAGDILVEAACLPTARKLVDERLPVILAGMQDALDEQFRNPGTE